MVKIKQRVFFSASPKYYDADGSMNSMDNEIVFGKRIMHYSYKQGVEDGLLKDMEVITAIVTSTQIEELIASNKIIGGEGGNTTARSAAVQIATAMAIKKYNLSRIIGFYSSVTGARQSARDFNVLSPDLGVSHIVASCVDGAMPTDTVREEIAELKAGNRILNNCRVIGVGTNVVEVDAIIFSDPKTAPADIKQNVGRGIRKKRPQRH